MNMKFILASSVVTASMIFCAGTSYASDGTITINGQLSSATCTVKLNNGSSSGTVTLPSVSTTTLPTSGSVAGATNFALNLSGCTAGKTINAYFEAGPTVDTVTGNLLNGTTAGNATNVEVQLLTDASTPISVGSSAQATSKNIVTSGTVTSGILNYAAQYYATGVTTAGPVSTSVTYSLTYN